MPPHLTVENTPSDRCRALGPALKAAVWAAVLLCAPMRARGWRLWTGDGQPVAAFASDQKQPQLVSASGGGAFVVWVDSRSYGSTGFDIYALRVTSAGAPAAGWPAGGLPVVAASGDQEEPLAVSDGAGGFIVSWSDSRSGDADVRAQRVDSSGSLLWAAGGVVVASGPTAGADQMGLRPAVLGTAALFAFIDLGSSTSFYAQGLSLSGGAPLFGAGLFLGAAANVTDADLAPSPGQGGPDGAVAVIGSDMLGNPSIDLSAVRFTTSGAVSWAVPVSTAGGAQGGGQGQRNSLRVVPDGSGGIYAVWVDSRAGSETDLYALRLTSAGAAASGWTPNGTAVSAAAGDQTEPFLVAAGTQGVVASWRDARADSGDIYAQYLSPAGALQWPSAGVRISSSATGVQRRPFAAAAESSPNILYSWMDSRDGGEAVYVQLVGLDGYRKFEGAFERVGGSLTAPGQYDPAVVPVGAEFIVAWEDTRDIVSQGADIYAQRLSTTPVPAPTTLAGSFSGVFSSTGGAAYNGFDPEEGAGVAMGPGGTVFIVGASSQGASGQDAIIIKYDSAGNRLADARRDAAGSDSFSDLVVVGTAVYATGSQTGTVQYDLNLNQVAASGTGGEAIASDGTAIFLLSEDAGQARLTKLSLGLASQGSTTFPGSLFGPLNSSVARGGRSASLTAGGGFVYAVLSSTEGPNLSDISLRRFTTGLSASGSAAFSPGGGWTSKGHGVEVGTSGDVFATGTSTNGPSTQSVILRYSADLSLLQSSRTFTTNSHHDLFQDGSGNLYSAGHGGLFRLNADLTTYSCASDFTNTHYGAAADPTAVFASGDTGNRDLVRLVRRDLSSPGCSPSTQGGSNNGGVALAAAPNGELWGVYAAQDGGEVRRFSSAGVFLSSAGAESAAGGGRWSLAFDGSGNAYAVGTSSGPGTTGEDLAVYRFSASGAFLSSRTYDSGSNDYAFGSATGTSNALWIAGVRQTSGPLDEETPGARTYEAALWKYDTGAQTLSAPTTFFTSAGGEALYADAAVDGAGSVWVLGYSSSPLNAGPLKLDLELRKFDASGTLLSGPYKRTGFSAELDGGASVVLSSAAVYAAASRVNGQGNKDLALLKWDFSGSLEYERNWHSTSGGDEEVGDLALNPLTGNPYIAGTHSRNASGADAALWHYTSSGAFVFAAELTGEEAASGLAITGAGSRWTATRISTGPVLFSAPSTLAAGAEGLEGAVPPPPPPPVYSFSGSFSGAGGAAVSASGQNVIGRQVLVDTATAGGPFFYVGFVSTSAALTGAIEPHIDSIARLDASGTLLSSATVPGNAGLDGLVSDAAGAVYASYKVKAGTVTTDMGIAKFDKFLAPLQTVSFKAPTAGSPAFTNVTRLASDGAFIYAHNDGSSLIRFSPGLVAVATAAYTSLPGFTNGNGFALAPNGDVYAEVNDASSSVRLLRYPAAFNGASPSADVAVSTHLLPITGNGGDIDLAVYAGSVYALDASEDGQSVFVRKFDAGLNYTGVSSTFTPADTSFGPGELFAAPDGLYVLTSSAGPSGARFAALRFDADLVLLSTAGFAPAGQSAGGLGLGPGGPGAVLAVGVACTGPGTGCTSRAALLDLSTGSAPAGPPPLVHARAAGEFVVSEEDDGEMSASAAFGGGKYIAGWENVVMAGTVPVSFSVGAQMFDPSGSLVGAPLSLSSSSVSGWCGESWPALASDGTNFLLVAGCGGDFNSALQAHLVGPTGALLGSRIDIHSGVPGGESAHGNVAFDGANYFVVWSSSSSGDHDLYGRFISTSGALVGSTVTIRSGAGQQREPWVAFGGGAYLVAWHEDTRFLDGYDQDVMARVVLPNGTMPGTAFRLDDLDIDSRNPVPVGYGDGRFFVVYHENTSFMPPGHIELKGIFVSTGGSPGSPFPIRSGSGLRLTADAPVWDGVNWRLLWSEPLSNAGDGLVTLSTTEVKLVVLDSSGTPTGAPQTVAAVVSGKAPALGVQVKGDDEILMLLSRQNPGGGFEGRANTDLYARVLSQIGGGEVFAQAQDLAPAALPSTASDLAMLLVRLWTDGASRSLGSLDISLRGDAPAGQITAKVFRDSNEDGVLQPSTTDAFLGSASFAAGFPPKALVSFAPQLLGGTTQGYIVAFGLAGLPGGRSAGAALDGPADIGAPPPVSGLFPVESSQPSVQVLLAANPADAPGYPAPQAAPAAGGFDTGLFLSPGQVFGVEASGSWDDGAGAVSADGRAGQSALAGLKKGSLIGRVGSSGAWFQLGAASTVTAASFGNLFLAMSDTAYSDNSGALSVAYEILPSTAAKLWLGGTPGGPTLASLGSNWSGGVAPFPGDRVVFSSASGAADCDWNLFHLALSSLDIGPGYSGTFRVVGGGNSLRVTTHTAVAGGELSLEYGQTVTVEGLLRVEGGATLAARGGRLETKGLLLGGGAFLLTPGSLRSDFTNLTNGPRWDFDIRDASVTVAGAGLRVLDSAGIDLSSLAVVNAFNDISVDAFDGPSPGPSLVLHSSAPAALFLAGWEFGLGVSTNADASGLAAGSTVQFLNASGPRMGTPFEKDPSGLLFWTPDGGGTGTLQGTVSYAGTQGGAYQVLATTTPRPEPAALSVLTQVSSGTVFSLSLQAPNTWYLFAFKGFGAEPAGFDPRGGRGHPGSLRSDPVFVGAGATATGADAALEDWGSVDGNISISASQVGPVRVAACRGACSPATLEAEGPAPYGGFYSLSVKPATDYAVVAWVDVDNDRELDGFEAFGSSAVIGVSALSAHSGADIAIAGGSAAPGGTVALATAAAHAGGIASSGAQALLKLTLSAAGGDATLGALALQYLGPPAPYGASIELFEDDGDGQFRPPFDGGLDQPRAYLFLGAGSSSGTAQLFTPLSVSSGSSRTLFAALDLNGFLPPSPAGLSVSTSASFGLSAGQMASQPGLYPVSASAPVLFRVPASLYAFPEGTGGAFTGFIVYPGQQVTVAAQGFWSPVAGSTVGPAGAGPTGLNTTLPPARVGELIARVQAFSSGSSPWFRVGSSATAAVPVGGELVLAMNDFVGGHGDNSGGVLAAFTVSGSTLGAVQGTIAYSGGASGSLLVEAERSLIVEGSTTLPLTAAVSYPYAISGLPPGPYTIKARVLSDPAQNGRTPEDVFVAAGSTATADFQVFGGTNSVSGTLQYSGVMGFGEFRLAVATTTDFERDVVFFGQAQQSSTGAFTITDLPAPNTYYLVAFRDGNYDQKPDGPEPFGYYGTPGGSLAEFSSLLAPIFVPAGGSPATGISVTLADRGSLSGLAQLGSSGSGRVVVVEAGRGVPGAPGYQRENRDRVFAPAGPAGGVFYELSLLRPATDYSIFAFADTDFDGQVDAGEPTYAAQGVAIPAGGNVSLDLPLQSAQPPAAVGAFSAAGGAGQVLFSWAPAAGATAYELLTATGGVRAALPGSATSHADIVSDNAVSAIVAVRATGLNGAGPSSFVPPTRSLAAVPAGLSAAPATTSAALSWASSNPVGTLYQVFRATDAAAPYSLALASAATTAADAGLSPATTYFWKVRAVNGDGIPTAFSASTGAATSPSSAPSIAGLLSYAGAQPGLLRVEAYLSSSFSGASTASALLPTLGSQAYYLPVAGGATYFVRAFVDADGDGVRDAAEDAGQLAAGVAVAAAPSSGNDFSIAADTVPPAAPAGLYATPFAGRVDISWIPPAVAADGSPLLDLAGFSIQRTTTPSAAGSWLDLTTAPTAGTFFSDASPVAGAANYYRVSALDLGRNRSPYTAPVPATPLGGGTISGVLVSYAAPGAGAFRVRLATTPFANSGYLRESNLESFAFTGLADGVYYLRAFRDANNDGLQNALSEPAGTFGGLRFPYPIQILSGSSVSGATVEVCDRTRILVSSTLAGSLAGGDCPAKDKGPGHTTDLFAFVVGDGSPGSVGLGARVEIRLESEDFDGELILLGPGGGEIARDNRSGGAVLSLTLNEPGVYVIEPTSFFPGGSGAYTLRLGVSGGFAGAIAGSISYSGARPGVTYAQLFNSPAASAFPVLVSSSPAPPPAPYSFAGLPDGIYYARAFRDADGNGVRDPGEPSGTYGVSASSPAAISILGGVSSLGASPADITMTDPAVGAVSGTVFYEGSQRPLRVEAGPRACPGCEDLNVVSFATMSAPGAFVLPLLSPATNYVVRAYADVNGNLRPDVLEAKASSSPVTVTANSTAAVSLALVDAGAGTAGNASLVGTISYGGAATGTILLAFSREASFGQIDYVVSLSSPGAYAKTGVLGGATYYMAAFRDVNGNGNPDDETGEPSGAGAPPSFSGTPSLDSPPPIFAPLTGSVTANLTLIDPPSGALLGAISYGGSASPGAPLVVQAYLPGSQVDRTSQRRVLDRAGSGPYPYRLGFLAAATYYQVNAFIDANRNDRPDFGEPYGQFPGEIAVSSGPGTFPVYGLDFALLGPGGLGAGGASGGRLRGHVAYLGAQSGPIFVRLFDNAGFAGTPAATQRIDSLPPGPGSADFEIGGLAFGDYWADAFRDPSGAGFFNPTFHAYGRLNRGAPASISQARPEGNVFGDVTDPGQGGSVNAFTGRADLPAGARFDGGAVDIAASAALDASTPTAPSLFVLGVSAQNSGVETLLVRYSSAGVFVSSTVVSAGTEDVGRIAVDAAGSVYLSGRLEDGADWSTATVTRRSASLAVTGSASLPGLAEARELAVSGGYLLAAGPARGASGTVRILKLDSSFVAVATGTYAFPSACSNCSTGVRGLGTDASGNVYAVATSGSRGAGRLSALLKFDSALNLLASSDVTDLSLPSEDGLAMAVSPSGDVALAGVPEGGSAAFTYRFNSGLARTAAASYSPVVVHFGGGIGNIAFDSEGGLYEAWEVPGNGGDFAVLRYDSALNLAAARTFDGFNGTLEDFPFSLAVLHSSAVYVSGAVNGGAGLDWATLRLDMNASGATSAAGQSVAVTTETASRAIVGDLLYGGLLASSGTFRAVLLPAESDAAVRFASAPFGPARPFVFNNLATGRYRVQAFLDLNANLQPDAGEPLGLLAAEGLEFAGANIRQDVHLCDRRATALGAEFTDALGPSDCPSQDHNGAPQRLYTFAGSRGQPATISMEALGFYDSFLALYGPNGRLLAADDESGGNGDGRISGFILPADGLYTVAAAAYSPGAFGAFRLKLSGSSGSRGSIAGDVSYTGTQGGQIVVALFDAPAFDSSTFVAARSLLQTRAFEFDGLDTGATYYLGAFVDVNFNQTPDDGEDSGVYGASGVPAPVLLLAGQNVTGVQVPIAVSTGAYAGQALVTGAVIYAGARSGPARVEFWSSASFTGRPVAIRDLPAGPGDYDIALPGGAAYFVRGFLDANGNFAPDPDEPKGFYSPNGQGAEALYAGAGEQLVGVNISLAEPGATSGGGAAGEGSAALSPSSTAAGGIFTATVTFTAGASGIQSGGRVGFSWPFGFAPPLSITATSTSAAVLSSVGFSDQGAFVTVQSGSLLPGEQVRFLYDRGSAPCGLSTHTFTVASAQNASAPPAPVFSGSPALVTAAGPATQFQPSSPYFSVRAGERSPALRLQAYDSCGNLAPLSSARTARLRAKTYDYATGLFSSDATVALSTAATGTQASELELSFAVGRSSRVYFVTAATPGQKSLEIFYDLAGEATFYYAFSALPGDALSAPSVSTASFVVSGTSVTITPNNDADADAAYVWFRMGDPNQGWHIQIASTPFKSDQDAEPLWESWGYGQPGPGQISWDGRSSPWVNAGARVPNGLYYVRIEVGGGVRDDSLRVRVNAPQVSGRFFDAGVTPNPPLAGARLQVYGPNGSIFTETDESGAYALPGVVAGTYNMTASRADFLDASLRVAVNAAGQVSTFTALNSAAAGAINSSSGLDVFMARAPALLVVPSLAVGVSTEAFDRWGSLQVRAASGPAAGQTVFGPLRLPAGTTTFDDGGQWDPASQRFVARTLLKFSVAAGTYTVEASLPGFSPSSATVFVGAGGRRVDLPAFSRKSSLSGLVTVPANPNGVFVSLNAVPLSTSVPGGGFGGVFLPAGATSASYLIAGLDAGGYLVRANAQGLPAVSSGPATVPANADLTGFDLQFLGTGAQISGAVTVNADTTGKSLALHVNVWAPGSFNFGSTVAYAAGGASGLAIPYLIQGLDPGATYQLYAHLEGADARLQPNPSLPLSVPAPAAANFSFDASSGVIAGTITLPAGATDFLNVDLFGEVAASPRPEDVGRRFSVIGSTNLPGFRCQPSGSAAPSGYCPAGENTASFLVTELDTETDDMTLFYRTSGDVRTTRISVVNGSTTTVAVSLAGQTYSISGSVANQIAHALFNTNQKLFDSAPEIPILDAQGLPAAIDPALATRSTASLARVVAVRQDLASYGVAVSTVFDAASSRVGYLTAAGTFTIANVPPGVYFVRTPDLRACATCEVLVPRVGQIVRVSNAARTGLSLTLADGYSVSGTIALEGTTKDARLFELSVLNRRQEIVRSTTAALGDAALGVSANSVDYRFTGLPAGEFYTLVVRGLLSPIKYVGRPIKFPDPALSRDGLQSNLSGQNVTMQRAAYVVGRLKDANTGELITARNATMLAPNFAVTATANPWVEGGYAVARASVAGRPIEADGYFRVGPLLPQTRYDIRLAQTRWDPAFLAQGSQNYAPVTLSGILTQPGASNDVDIVSLSQGQSLSGVLRQAGSTMTALGNIKVTARPSFGFVDLKVETFTNPQGRYTLWVSSAVSPQYDVTAAPRDGNLASNGLVYGEKTLRSVNLLGTTTADFLLEPLLVVVTGHVAVEDAAQGGELSYPFGDRKGFPAAAINIQRAGVVPTRHPLGDIEASSDERGDFSVAGLSTGTFLLRASSLGYNVYTATVVATPGSYRLFRGSDTPANYVAGNQIVLRRGASLTGRILKPDGSAPTADEIGGVAAANFAQGEFVLGGVDADPVAKTVNSYQLSGFKTGVDYDIVLLPKQAGDPINFPPEGSGVSFEASEATATKTLPLTYITGGFDCVPASKKAIGNNQFLLRIECSKALRNVLASDSDLDALLAVSTFPLSGAAFASPDGSGTMLGSEKTISASRRRLTAIYRAQPSEARFSVRLRAYAADLDPKTGTNFQIDKVFDFLVGLESNATKKLSNIEGGEVELEATEEDEGLGLSERARVGFGPGTFSEGANDAGSVVVASRTVEISMARGRDLQLARLLYTRALGYAPAGLAALGRPTAFPEEMWAAMRAYRTQASTSSIGGADPISSFYSIFLPAGIRHQLKTRADLTLSYTLGSSTGTADDAINVWFYNAVLGRFVLENNNRRLDTFNKTITVSVDHMSTFVVLNSTPVLTSTATFAGSEVIAVNFPNPSDCTTHTGIARNSILFGSGGTHGAFAGTMVRTSVPAGSAADLTINIYSLAGEKVRSIAQGTVPGGQTYYTPWNCANDAGRQVASGVYIGEAVWGGKKSFFKIAIIKGSGL